MLLVELALARVVVLRSRTNWFWGVVAATTVVIFLIASIEGTAPLVALRKNRQNIFILINIVSVILMTVTAATEIPRDITERMVMIYLTKPITRQQVIIGKFLGVAGVGIVFAVVTSFIAIIVLLVLGLPPDRQIAHLGVGLVLRLLMVAAAAVMATASMTEMMGMVFTSTYAFIGFFINYIAQLVSDDKLPQAVRMIAGILIILVPNLNTFEIPESSLAVWTEPAPLVATTPTGGTENQEIPLGAKLVTPTSKQLARSAFSNNDIYPNNNFEDPLGRQFKPVQFRSFKHFCFACLYAFFYTGVLLGVGTFLFNRRVIA